MESCEKGQMPQRNNCSYAVLAQVQGGQASCEGDPTGLQAQGCLGVKPVHFCGPPTVGGQDYALIS